MNFHGSACSGPPVVSPPSAPLGNQALLVGSLLLPRVHAAHRERDLFDLGNEGEKLMEKQSHSPTQIQDPWDMTPQAMPLQPSKGVLPPWLRAPPSHGFHPLP